MGAKLTRWNAADAARRAREDRLVTAHHLKTAPIMREWHDGTLRSALAAHVAYFGSVPTAIASLLTSHGYLPPFPQDWDDIVELDLTTEAGYFADAPIHLLTPTTCAMVTAAAQTLTLADLRHMDRDDLPGAQDAPDQNTPLSGTLVLPHSLLSRSVNGTIADHKAFTWYAPATILWPDLDSGELATRSAVRTSAYLETHGPVQTDEFTRFALEAEAQHTPLPPLLLHHIACTPLRTTYSEEQLNGYQRYAAAARQRAQVDATSPADHEVIGEHELGSIIDDLDGSLGVRMLYAYWRLCKQKIIRTDNEAAQPDNSGGPAKHAPVTPDVRVAYLREYAQSQHKSRDATDHEWHHRWIVRMHKVDQWYPSQQCHKPIFRGPFPKGPSDKPLLTGEITRAMTR